MGSLMAGWNSSRISKKGMERNLSLTREEIENYWKNRQQSGASSSSPPSAKKSVQKSNTFSLPEHDQYQLTTAEKASFLSVSSQREILKSKTFNGREAAAEVNPELALSSAPAGWWTRTHWAFLNEPPVLESAANKRNSYISQHNITKMKEPESSGVSTCVF